MVDGVLLGVKMRTYAGIGSRETPSSIGILMSAFAEALAIKDPAYLLRSGGAEGADTYFEEGARVAGGPMEIYLPWERFNGNPSPLCVPSEEAYRIAKIHTAKERWNRLSDGARKLKARNVHQLLGRNCNDPVEFVICWTPGGEAVGGTGMNIRLAQHIAIPVYNLGLPNGPQRVLALLDGLT